MAVFIAREPSSPSHFAKIAFGTVFAAAGCEAKAAAGCRSPRSPEFHSKLLRQRVEGLLVGGVDFLGLEGARGFAVVEAVGDGLAVGGEFLTGRIGEDVEALEALEQRFAEFLQDVSDVRVGRSGGGGDSLSA